MHYSRLFNSKHSNVQTIVVVMSLRKKWRKKRILLLAYRGISFHLVHIAIFRAVSGVNLSRDTNRFCNAVNWGYLAINRASEIDFRAKTGVRTKRVAIRIAHIAHIAPIRQRRVSKNKNKGSRTQKMARKTPPPTVPPISMETNFQSG